MLKRPKKHKVKTYKNVIKENSVMQGWKPLFFGPGCSKAVSGPGMCKINVGMLKNDSKAHRLRVHKFLSVSLIEMIKIKQCIVDIGLK